MDHATPNGRHPDPCYGQGGPQCWGPTGQNCPDCGRLWGKRKPQRVAYSYAKMRTKLEEWMLSEFGDPKAGSDIERKAWLQRYGLIAHFIRCHFQP